MGAFEKCCCCIPLQVGVLIIGVLGVIGSIYQCIAKENTIGSYIGYTISLAVTIFLIVGAVQKKRYFLMPWLVFAIIGAVALVLVLILAVCGVGLVSAAVAHDDPEKANVSAAVAGVGIAVILIFGLIVEALMIFFILVVHSFYCELRDEDENPRTRNRYDQKGYYPTAAV